MSIGFFGFWDAAGRKGNNTMKCKALLALRLLLRLLVFAAGSDQTGGFGLVLQQIETIGPRQWLTLMAGTIVSGTPITAQIASVLPRRLLPLRERDTTA